MKNAVTRKNLDKVEAKVIQDNTNLDYRLDGNNVDIDVEMAAMAKNTIKYNVFNLTSIIATAPIPKMADKEYKVKTACFWLYPFSMSL